MLLTKDTLQELRHKTKLSRERFARLLGCSIASINRWEAGSSSPSGTVLSLYQALYLAQKHGADLRKIAVESELREPPYFIYSVMKAAYED